MQREKKWRREGDREVNEEVSSKYLVVQEYNQAINQFAST